LGYLVQLFWRQGDPAHVVVATGQQISGHKDSTIKAQHWQQQQKTEIGTIDQQQTLI
jgi:hypothetical protein